MRRYVIVLVLMAILIGSLFRASAQTGVRLMNMFATIGIFLFGVVGTLALNRWQSSAGAKELQGAIKSLEPDWLITDWAGQGGGRPDYLLVGPGGIVAVCVDETPQSTWTRFAHKRIGRSLQRAENAVRWLRERQPELTSPVTAVLLLTRRRADEAPQPDTIAVLNPEQLAAHVRGLQGQELLDQRARITLTRAFRSA